MVFNKITELFTISKIKDATQSYYAKVDGSGNLYTVTPTPEAPAGKTPISSTQLGDVTSTTDTFTVIPNATILTIQRLKGGSEFVNGGCKVAIYYAPNGNTTGIELIEILYVNSNSAMADLNYQSPAGNGTRAILLRRVNFGGGSIEVFGKWEGYY